VCTPDKRGQNKESAVVKERVHRPRTSWMVASQAQPRTRDLRIPPNRNAKVLTAATSQAYTRRQ